MAIVDRIAPPSTDNKEISPAEKVSALVRNYESAQIAPEGAVAYTLTPHVERDRKGNVIESYGQQDLSAKGEVFLLMQAGHSEDTTGKDNRFVANESHRAVIAHIIPSPTGVEVEYAYLDLGQKVESLPIESVLEAFKNNTESVVYGTSEAYPTEMGSRPRLWMATVGMLHDEKGIGNQPPIDRRGVFAKETTVIERDQVVTKPTDIQLGLPHDVEEGIFGYQTDDEVLEIRIK